ncbi:hypothetical protein V8C86DRAFT_550956 [Haematococcus lacustris]
MGTIFCFITASAASVAPLSLAGPFLAAGYKVLSVNVPIMMRNVNANETWGIPWGADLLDKCPECYNNATRTKWWGFAALSLSLDSVLEDSAGTKLLSQLDGLHYRLSVPTLANAAEDQAFSTLYESTDKAMASESLCREVLVLEDKWRLCVWKASWQPTYLVPLLVVLVLVALALSAATFTVLLSRYEHRALLHSLLPRAAIEKMQAEFKWASVNDEQSQVAMVESGTPAEMILSVMDDILLGRPPVLPKVMAVRHTLQQSLDVYKPLQADLTQRMADADNMDGEVRDALMLQLVGRRAEAEVEEEGGRIPLLFESGCYASPDASVHTVITVHGEERLPAARAAASPSVEAVSEPLVLSACSSTAAGPVEEHEVQADASHNLPAVIDPAPPCLVQPGPQLASRNSVDAATYKQVAARLKQASSQQPASCTASHPDAGAGSPAAVRSMLEHMMSQQQPEALAPSSGTALLAAQAGHLLSQHPTCQAAHHACLGGHNNDNDGIGSYKAAASLPLQLLTGAGAGADRAILSLGDGGPRGQVHQVESCLSSANSWAFDAFQLTSATAGRPLSVLAYWLLHQSGLAAWAHLDHTKLARWLCRIEDGYCANPYHNRSHAADVVQTMHMLLTRGGLMPGYADHLTQLAAYLAAVCHDYQHIGRTNDWLVETQDELALRYNDRSPMENHHLAGAFNLLKHPDMNFLQAMPKATYDRLRKLMIELVLGTDMKQHFSIIGQFTALHRPGGDGQAAGKTAIPSHVRAPQQARSSNSSAASFAKDSSQDINASLQPVSDQDKLLSLQMALKCSDLGHLAAPLPVHLAWVSRLEAEFFAQGDAERAQGLTISPLCDRTKQGITKSQVGFFDFVALPLFTNFTARFTAAKPLLRGVMANYRHWQVQAAAVAVAESQAPTGVGCDQQTVGRTPKA